MALVPNPSSIYHFSHNFHPLFPVDSNNEFKCDGCNTHGTGKRYRCNGCDFDLHDYCATCPRLLTSFMHPHRPLALMIQHSQQTWQTCRVCDVCRDPVEGLFYTCNECNFHVHPVCTQLPEKLNHALHQMHPLVLQTNTSSMPNFCSICNDSCNGWRYRCSICNFDIHLECVLTPVVSCSTYGQTGQRSTPFQPPPQFAPYYGGQYPGPCFMYHGPGYDPYQYQHGGPYMHPQQNSFVQPQNCYNEEGGSDNNNAGKKRKRLGRSMFYLVGNLACGVLSSMIFGVFFG